jgi:hypothetical protein
MKNFLMRMFWIAVVIIGMAWLINDAPPPPDPARIAIFNEVHATTTQDPALYKAWTKTAEWITFDKFYDSKPYDIDCYRHVTSLNIDGEKKIIKTEIICNVNETKKSSAKGG